MKNIFFITGTDTQVGKTVVTALLAQSLLQRGLDVRVRKPIETGLERLHESTDGISDAEYLCEAAGRKESLDDICFHRFRAPLAPSVAAEKEGVLIGIQPMLERIRAAAMSCDVLLVEGAGGVLVPITWTYTFADFAADLQARVILVVASRLGCLNHAALSLECLKKREISLAGYVVNEPYLTSEVSSMRESAALSTNREALARLAAPYAVPEVLHLPYNRNLSSVSGVVSCALSQEVDQFSERIIDYSKTSG